MSVTWESVSCKMRLAMLVHFFIFLSMLLTSIWQELFAVVIASPCALYFVLPHEATHEPAFVSTKWLNSFIYALEISAAGILIKEVFEFDPNAVPKFPGFLPNFVLFLLSVAMITGWSYVLLSLAGYLSCKFRGGPS